MNIVACLLWRFSWFPEPTSNGRRSEKRYTSPSPEATSWLSAAFSFAGNPAIDSSIRSVTDSFWLDIDELVPQIPGRQVGSACYSRSPINFGTWSCKWTPCVWPSSHEESSESSVWSVCIPSVFGRSINFKIPKRFLCRRLLFPDYLSVSCDYDITR